MKIFGKIFENKEVALKAILNWQKSTAVPDEELKNVFISSLSYQLESRVVVAYNAYDLDTPTTTAWFEYFVQRFTEEENSGMCIDGVVGQCFYHYDDEKDEGYELTHITTDKNQVFYDIKKELMRSAKNE